ncbi:MAG: hypothetical protein KC646_11590 [Candidatus Cloacimonetes bacterium]|nr:hypothetical protein [Candidatus Cloacimonadota bacterium]
MTFAFALHPRPSKEKLQVSKALFDSLNEQNIQSLLDYIQNDKVSSLESSYVIEKLIANKWKYFWIFAVPEVYDFFMNTDQEMKSSAILKKYCQFTRKLPKISIYSEPYYVQNDTPLWTRFLGDINQLGIDQNDHLYHNLKYFLEWEQYKVDKESKPLIAQILSPFYTSLKLNPNIPIPFLAETLKLLLFLDPKSPKGNFEYFILLQTACSKIEQIEFLEKVVKLPSQDKLLFMEYFNLKKDEDNLDLQLESLISQNNIKLDLQFFLDLSDLLVSQNKMKEAFYICLHAFVLSKKSLNIYSKLQSFFFYFGLGEQFDICKNLIPESSSKTIFINVPTLPKKLEYRSNHRSKWTKVNATQIQISSTNQVQVQFKFIDDKDEFFIFYPENQILQLQYDGTKLSLVAGVIPNKDLQDNFSFGNTKLIFSKNFLKEFKGFRKN